MFVVCAQMIGTRSCALLPAGPMCNADCPSSLLTPPPPPLSHLPPYFQQYLAQAHTQDFLEHMSARGWEAWGPASSAAACVVRGVSAVLSGKCYNALCLVEIPGGHAPSGGCCVGQGGRPAAKEGWPCSVNSLAVGALYAHLQW